LSKPLPAADVAVTVAVAVGAVAVSVGVAFVVATGPTFGAATPTFSVSVVAGALEALAPGADVAVEADALAVVDEPGDPAAPDVSAKTRSPSGNVRGAIVVRATKIADVIATAAMSPAVMIGSDFRERGAGASSVAPQHTDVPAEITTRAPDDDSGGATSPATLDGCLLLVDDRARSAPCECGEYGASAIVSSRT
jgi:hypothetical protein